MTRDEDELWKAWRAELLADPEMVVQMATVASAIARGDVVRMGFDALGTPVPQVRARR